MKIPANSEIFKEIEELAPKNKAYDWDNVGLQIGSYQKKSKKIMITLDVLETVADEAIAKEVDLIIAHHPLLFKPLKQIDFQTPEGRIISKLIRHDIHVYAAHTNLDVVEHGVNDMLADQLELKHTKPLVALGNEKLYKYAVYVPLSHKDKLKKALGDAGAGHIGDYSHCSFQVEGIGSFKPLEGADPYIGEVDEIAEVDEVKIEVIVPESKLETVISSAANAHPYEEPAFDIIPMKNQGEVYGLGRIGDVSETETLEQYVKSVKAKLGLSDVRAVGDLKQPIKKAAVVGGSGEKFIYDAKKQGADVLITGDMTFHTAQAAWQMGLAVIDAGHYIESVMKEGLRNYLQAKLKDREVEIIVSEAVTDPFQYL